MTAPTDSLASLAAYVDGLAAFVGYTPPSPLPSPIAFLASDTTTQGSWLGVYGGDGYVLPGIATSLPSYATVKPSGKTDFVWTFPPLDQRAIQTPDGTGRRAACWYSPNSFDVSVDVGPNPVRVALYFVDWDSGARAQRIDVLDSASNTLDSRAVGSFNKGVWLSWTVTGATTFRISRLAGQNAILSAICFGGSNQPPPPPPPPPIGDFTIQLVPVGLSVSQLAICQQAATRLMRIVTGPKQTLTVTLNAMAIDGAGGIVGSSTPTHYAGTPLLPVTAASTFDSADIANMEANGSLLDVITHELLHCLGLGTAPGWSSQLTGAGTSDPQFHGPQATAAYNAVMHNAALSVPVENQGGAGTADKHWRESGLGNELFTGIYNGGQTNPLSRITAGALADLGYTVNLDAADSYPA